MALVVNRHYDEFDVYIGRGTPLGNPFQVTDLCNRVEAIALFKGHLWRQIKKGTITLDYLRSLDGKRLGCSCYPKACHGDVVVAAIKWAKEQEMTIPIRGFNGPNRFLSNFTVAAVELDGVNYPTVEHAYQAAKTLEPEFREAIRLCETPGQAKRMGKQVPIRPDWEGVRVAVMLDLLRQKFYADYQRISLLGTGKREIIEENTWGDTFWGVCNGEGQNWMGKLLMQVREEVQ